MGDGIDVGTIAKWGIDIAAEVGRDLGAILEDNEDAVFAFAVDEVAGFEDDIVPRDGLGDGPFGRERVVFGEQEDAAAVSWGGVLDAVEDDAGWGKIRLPIEDGDLQFIL